MTRYRMSISEFRQVAFLGRAPSRHTIRRWLDTGELRGEKIGGTWYVIVDADGQPVRHRYTGHPGADELIRRWADGP